MSQSNHLLRPAAASALLAIALAVPFAGAQPAAQTDAQALARREITDLLASNAIQRVDIRATNYESAGTLMKTVADTYLAAAVTPLGGAKTAGAYAVAVINGLNDHRVKGAVRIFGGASLAVAGEQDAKDLGTLIATAAVAIHRAAAAAPGRVLLRDTAKNLFDAVTADGESTEPLLAQYLHQVKAIAAGPRARIDAFLVLAPGS